SERAHDLHFGRSGARRVRAVCPKSFAPPAGGVVFAMAAPVRDRRLCRFISSAGRLETERQTELESARRLRAAVAVMKDDADIRGQSGVAAIAFLRSERRVEVGISLRRHADLGGPARP